MAQAKKQEIGFYGVNKYGAPFLVPSLEHAMRETNSGQEPRPVNRKSRLLMEKRIREWGKMHESNEDIDFKNRFLIKKKKRKTSRLSRRINRLLKRGK